MADVHTLHSVQVSNSNNPLSSEEQRKMDAYWRAANYLSVGQIYLYANPLLREPIAPGSTSRLRRFGGAAGTERPKPEPLRRGGIRTSSRIRRATELCFRFCSSMVTRSQTRPFLVV